MNPSFTTQTSQRTHAMWVVQFAPPPTSVPILIGAAFAVLVIAGCALSLFIIATATRRASAKPDPLHRRPPSLPSASSSSSTGPLYSFVDTMRAVPLHVNRATAELLARSRGRPYLAPPSKKDA